MKKLFALLLLATAAGWLALGANARPAAANPLTGVVSISAGANHTCAVTNEGGVLCWGSNLTGAIGDGTGGEEPPGNSAGTVRTSPMQVVGLESGVAAVAVGPSHSCALTKSGGVKCWGDDVADQVGASAGDKCYYIRLISIASGAGWPCAKTPVAVEGLTTGVTAIAAGGIFSGFTCALMGLGQVQCWGDHSLGHFGTGPTATEPNTPVCARYDVITEQCLAVLAQVTGLSVGGEHACAIIAASEVWCWGSNESGQLGRPPGSPCFVTIIGWQFFCSTIAVPVCRSWDAEAQDCSERLREVTAVSAGANQTCATTTEREVYCWGANAHGQLGAVSRDTCAFPLPVNEFACSSSPLTVDGLDSGVAAIAAGGTGLGAESAFTCALSATGVAKCWGSNLAGQLGSGGAAPIGAVSGPRRVCALYESRTASCSRSLTGIANLTSGASHACGVIDDELAKCWGNNTNGQLGNGCSNLTYPDGVQARSGVGDVIHTTKAPPGDADADQAVTSIDAQLVLQYDAALIQTLPCPNQADVDGDRRLNAIDASLVLQRAAGIIS